MYYFAYGSNMNFKQMEARCPSAHFIKRAFIENYKFVYDGYSSYRGGAVANIVPENDRKVWGALYEIDQKCLKSLDEKEGYPRIYGRKLLKVKDEEGNEYEAWVYLRALLDLGKPSEEYLKIVYQGARDCSLPDNYIDEFILGKGKCP